ncbi:hypothetical protein B0H17DRAFT_1096092 [Mycena rosella]|uniref:PWWP domain-containing protein n=1 Tax=Mycena rosella TaxID=1033263 RepID=A0AAD7G1Y7_MYCRO|nr:hypothetical protein B0H17DRAFT_1096092 [Mycena rosella]
MSAKKSSSSAAKKAEMESFETRDVVLGKIRGFPPWPGMVVDPDGVPKTVSKERPANKKSVVYAVRFFPAGDYAWLGPKELTRLTPGAISAFVGDAGTARKGGELMEGYRKALDPAAWEKEHAANSVPAPKKRKSKSKAKKEEDGEEDELVEEAPADEDNEEAEAEADEDEKPGKKRKRASPAPAKAKAKAKPKAAAKGGKKGGKAKKSKAAVESEDEAGEGGDAEAEAEAEAEGEEGAEEGEERASKKVKTGDASAKLESDPEALKVREWRHKLQKTFLSSNKSLPKEDEMPAVNTLFTTVEGYQNMNIDYLTFSKIGKVMRHIHLLEPGKVPRDDEYNFRDRAKALVDKWHNILNANKTGAAAAAGVAEGAVTGDGAAGEGEGDLTVLDVAMEEAA